MRIFCSLAILVLMLPVSAVADDHRADIFAGGSYAKSSHLFGAHGSAAVALPGHVRWSVIALDASVQGDGDETRSNFMSGIRYTLPVKDHVKHKVFVHALVGLGQKSEANASNNDFAAAYGGGWEYIWDKAADDVNGFRVQLDYVVAQGLTNNFPRLSFGYVRRLK